MDPLTRIGNDVVDLDAPELTTTPLHPRYMERVCCEQEMERIQAAGNPRLLLWSLFAAKEAAYKAARKNSPGLVFAHRLFVVSDDLTEVCHPNHQFSVQVKHGQGWVHAIAVTRHLDSGPELEPMPSYWLRPRNQNGDASAQVRQLLCHSVAPLLGCMASELAVVRDVDPQSWSQQSPPRLTWGGQATAIDISLSHDGRFLAAAARL